MNDKIIIKGAKEHNLKNINVEIPRDKMVVITGLSGSGKSSLAFDTIYAEGQRRYVESLSSYARQFLGVMEKPNVDKIEGLSPAISIDQKTTSKNPRSTVGTVTEIYDYIRLLYARIGVPYCPNCNKKIEKQTIDQIVDKVLELEEGTRIQVLAPVVRGKKGEYKKELESYRKAGFVRVQIDGQVYDLSEDIQIDKNKKHYIEIIVDRLLEILGVEHLHYQLIHADVEINGRVFETWVCASEDFKQPGENKNALDGFYQVNSLSGESRYDFCVRNGWQRYVDTMLAVDYLIMNRDRHGANIEVLRNARKKTLRIAPLFDHGLSFLCSCMSKEEIEAFDINKDLPCQNFIGGRSTLDNLSLIKDKNSIFHNKLLPEHHEKLIKDLDDVISVAHMEKIWEMLYSRWCYYESLCNL